MPVTVYLRRHRKKVEGELYEYWSLVKSVRTARGPRQQTVAFIGKTPGLDRRVRMGWEQVGDALAGKVHVNDVLERDDDPQPASWVSVDTSRVRVERQRDFGSVYVGLALWRRLDLDKFFGRVVGQGRAEIPWSMMACILTLARLCEPSSELQIAEAWYARTALDELLGVPVEKVNDDRLYRALDAALPARDLLFTHLRKRFGELFSSQFDILLYDITSTYFEGQMKANPRVKRGYSRDNRSDCVQLCIGLVVTLEGLPVAYEVFDGNTVDVTTVQQIIETMRTKYGHERRTWVMDRGMVSEENLTQLREWGASYLVGTPKSMLRNFEKQLLADDWTHMANGVDVKLCQSPDSLKETFVICRSPGRIEKERAMRQRQVEGFEAGLTQIALSCQRPRGPVTDQSLVERRIGRLLERYPAAGRLFDIRVCHYQDQSGPRLRLEHIRRQQPTSWEELRDGCYLLRTNMDESDPAKLWQMYIGLTQVEFSFRVTKSDLSIRPIFHRLADRSEAHILVCFLALVLWRTLEMWMKASDLGTCPRKLLEEMAQVQSMDVVLPTHSGTDLRLRVVARPEQRLAILLDRLDLPLPSKPRQIPNVVPKTASNFAQVQCCQ